MASNPNYCDITPEIEALAAQSLQNSSIDAGDYVKYDVKRGLRDLNGKGVLAGLTEISDIIAKKMVDGQEIPCDGKLYYRGIDVEKLVAGALKEGRFGFEETAYLLLLGRLPNAAELESFKNQLAYYRTLPGNFVRDVILKAPSQDIMNSLARSVLNLASYDERCDDISLPNVMRQCLQLIALFPVLSVYGYQAYTYKSGNSLYIHAPQPELSTAENILSLLRPDSSYSFWEAHVLDICLTLHAEHGGGNNSTFTTHVVTSSGTDTYSCMAAALASLKGPKHGGANIKVAGMHQDLMDTVADYTDEGQVADYLRRILRKEAYDKSGLIYGMGHAVYTLSDPRAVLCKKYARELARGTEFEPQFELIETIERLSPELFREEHKSHKVICANIDMYSGLVYKMLGIPQQLYTPLFATARIAGWAAHRFEEIVEGRRIIRPAYKSVYQMRDYVPMDVRENGMEKETAADLPVNRDYYND